MQRKKCKNVGCENFRSPCASSGLCSSCYSKLRHEREKNYSLGVCSVQRCNKPVHRRKLCKAHYEQVRKHGKITHEDIWSPDGRREHPLWRTWDSMLRRCKHDKRYVRKGISVCKRWQGRDGFYNFVEDMGPRPEGRYPSGRPMYTLDRIDNSKGYYKENCRWASKHTQAINRDTSSDMHNISKRTNKDGSTVFLVDIQIDGKRIHKKTTTLIGAIRLRKRLECLAEEL